MDHTISYVKISWLLSANNESIILEIARSPGVPGEYTIIICCYGNIKYVSVIKKLVGV